MLEGNWTFEIRGFINVSFLHFLEVQLIFVASGRIGTTLV